MIFEKKTEVKFIKDHIVSVFWENFWTSRMVLDRGSSFRLIETTVSLAGIVGLESVLGKLIYFLKEDNENLRKITMKVIKNLMENYDT